MRTYAYGDDPAQVADLLTPEGAGPWPVIALLHGGFWRMPYGREDLLPIARDLQSCGYAVWDIEYRRVGAVGGGWPGTFVDALTALDHLTKVRDDGAAIDLSRVAVVGHSAGGQLALFCGARGEFKPVERAARVEPKIVVGLAAVCDLASAEVLNLGRGAVVDLLGADANARRDRIAQVSPRERLPLGTRQLVMHGDGDTAVPVAMARDYVRAAREAGDRVDYIEIESGQHMDFVDPASASHGRLCEALSTAL